MKALELQNKLNECNDSIIAKQKVLIELLEKNLKTTEEIIKLKDSQIFLFERQITLYREAFGAKCT